MIVEKQRWHKKIVQAIHGVNGGSTGYGCTCSGYGLEQAFTSHLECSWTRVGECSFKPCNYYTSMAECVEILKCKWTVACTDNCIDFTTESECTGRTECKWSNDACIDKTCPDYTIDSEF